MFPMPRYAAPRLPQRKWTRAKDFLNPEPISDAGYTLSDIFDHNYRVKTGKILKV